MDPYHDDRPFFEFSVAPTSALRIIQGKTDVALAAFSSSDVCGFCQDWPLCGPLSSFVSILCCPCNIKILKRSLGSPLISEPHWGTVSKRPTSPHFYDYLSKSNSLKIPVITRSARLPGDFHPSSAITKSVWHVSIATRVLQRTMLTKVPARIWNMWQA